MTTVKKGEVVSDPFHLATAGSVGQMRGLRLAQESMCSQQQTDRQGGKQMARES